MPSKKGSKIAASQARAKSAAKKKANSTGPVVAAAAALVPADDAVEDGDVSAVATAEVDGDAPEAAAPAAAAAPAPRRTGRTASRRERQALTVMSAGSLKRELAMIGAVTAFMGIGLAVIKLATDLGR